MAGFFGIGDFTKEGKGVSKDAPKKRGVFAFFELFFRKFWKLCKLNVLYALTAIPTFIVMFIIAGFVTQNLISMNMQANDEFAQSAELLDLILRFFVALVVMTLWGVGPVSAGFSYVLRNYAREEHSWLWSDFWQHTKANFKQAIVVWALDVVVFVLLTCAYMFYSTQASILFYIRYVIMWIAIIYTMMHFYIYPIMVTFKMSLKEIYRNSLLLSIAKLPVNLCVLAVLLIVHVGVPYFGIMGFGGRTPMLYWIIFFVLEFVILISMTGFMTSFSSYQYIKQFMLPEEAKDDDEDESVFSEERTVVETGVE